MTKIVMSTAHVIFLHNELKKVCKKRGEFAVYLAEQTDQSVALAAQDLWSAKNPSEPFAFNATHVANIRKQMIGQLKDRKTIHSKNDNKEVVELRIRVGNLEKRIDALELEFANYREHGR